MDTGATSERGGSGNIPFAIDVRGTGVPWHTTQFCLYICAAASMVSSLNRSGFLRSAAFPMLARNAMSETVFSSGSGGAVVSIEIPPSFTNR